MSRAPEWHPVNKSAAAASHWLIEVAGGAALAGAERLTLEPQIGLADAWVSVARGCGISEDDLARHVATRYKIGIADLANATPLAQALVPEKAARRYQVFPLRENDRQLVVATANPADLDAEQALGVVSGRTPVFEVAPPAALQEALDHRYAPDRLVENLIDGLGAEFEDVEFLEESGPEQVAAKDVETTPVVKLTNLILRDAVRSGASDIHLEPGRDGALVRFRVDGVLRTHMRLPMPALNRVISRIKILGKLDIADRMRPQDAPARVQDLRSTLRQDADVLLVGEIRDPETAEIAVQASLTGHLVLATLHANDAVAAVARFTGLGLDRVKLASTMRGSVAQRLMRRVCPSCAVPTDGALAPEEAKLVARYGVTPKVRAVGCAKCAQTGYRGRIPVVEVLIGSAAIEGLISSGVPAADLQRAAVAGGMRTLREVALERVRSGETTRQEVERVLGGATEDVPATAAPSRALLVDDDSVIRALARGVLQKNGYEVTEAADGLAALDVLAADPGYALMVLDLDMPRMGGLEALGRVRSSVHTAALPVIVITGSTSEDTEVVAMDQGADDYVRKPIDPARFAARVKAALRRAAG